MVTGQVLNDRLSVFSVFTFPEEILGLSAAWATEHNRFIPLPAVAKILALQQSDLGQEAAGFPSCAQDSTDETSNKEGT